VNKKRLFFPTSLTPRNKSIFCPYKGFLKGRDAILAAYMAKKRRPAGEKGPFIRFDGAPRHTSNGRGLEKSFDKKHIRFTLIRCKRSMRATLPNIALLAGRSHPFSSGIAPQAKRGFFSSRYLERDSGAGATIYSLS
jgi:hypothetical protein